MQRLGVVQPSLFISNGDVAVRLTILFLLVALIVYVKKRIEANSRQRAELIRQNASHVARLEELNNAGNRINAILDSQAVAVIVSNKEGNITYVNEAANTLFGYEKGEMLSLHIADLVPEELRDIHKEDRRKFFDDPRDRIMNPHEDYSRGVRSDGTELRLHISLGWFYLGDELLAVATVEDVLEKFELEEVKARATAAEETIRVRDRFLSIAAHELKTPIASIILYADLLERYYVNTLEAVKDFEDTFAERKELTDKSIKAIQRQALNISLLVNQFLDISLLRDVNIITIHREHIEICKLLREIIDLSQLQTTKHTIRLDCDKEMEGYVDRLRMEQIIVNLLNNAIKYSPDGGDIVVTARELESHSVSIKVRDHGLGIPEEVKDKIFTRFFRAHQEIVSDGLGLGLYLSREIMKAHKGVINFDTPDDGEGGTVFTVTFPPEHETIESERDIRGATKTKKSSEV